MEKKEKPKKRESFIIKIGPLLKEVLDKQKKNISDITYNICLSSNYEAGEIIAKKIIENSLI